MYSTIYIYIYTHTHTHYCVLYCCVHMLVLVCSSCGHLMVELLTLKAIRTRSIVIEGIGKNTT